MPNHVESLRSPARFFLPQTANSAPASDTDSTSASGNRGRPVPETLRQFFPLLLNRAAPAPNSMAARQPLPNASGPPSAPQPKGLPRLPNELVVQIFDRGSPDANPLALTSKRYHSLLHGRVFLVRHRHLIPDVRLPDAFHACLNEIVAHLSDKPQKRDRYALVNVLRSANEDFGSLNGDPASHRSMALAQLSKRLPVCSRQSAATRAGMLDEMSRALLSLPGDQQRDVLASMIALIPELLAPAPFREERQEEARQLLLRCLRHLMSVPQAQQGGLMLSLHKAARAVGGEGAAELEGALRQHASTAFSKLKPAANAEVSRDIRWNLICMVGLLPDAQAREAAPLLEKCLADLLSLPLPQQGDLMFRLARLAWAAGPHCPAGFASKLRRHAAVAFSQLDQAGQDPGHSPADVLLSMLHLLSVLDRSDRFSAAQSCHRKLGIITVRKQICFLASTQLIFDAVSEVESPNWIRFSVLPHAAIIANEPVDEESLDPAYAQALLNWYTKHMAFLFRQVALRSRTASSLNSVLLMLQRPEFRDLPLGDNLGELLRRLPSAIQVLALVEQVQNVLEQRQSSSLTARTIIPLIRAGLKFSESENARLDRILAGASNLPRKPDFPLHEKNMQLLGSLSPSITGKGTGAPPTAAQQDVKARLRELEVIQCEFERLDVPEMVDVLRRQKIRLLNDPQPDSHPALGA